MRLTQHFSNSLYFACRSGNATQRYAPVRLASIQTPDTLSAGAAASGGAVSMSGVSGGGGGSANPAAPAGGPRGGTTTRSDDAERAALGTLNLALQFLFRVRPVGEPPASRLRTRSRTGSPNSVSQQAVDAPLAAAPPLARLAGRENGYHQACLPHVNPSVRTRRLFTDGCA